MTHSDSSSKKSVTGLMLILMSLFFMMFIVMGLCQSMLGECGLSERDTLLLSSALQAILVFVVPSLITACFESGKPFVELNLNISPTFLNLVGIILIFIIGSIFLNQIIYYNENISLPESLNSLELKMKEMEESASKIADILLSGSTYMDLLLEILIIGFIAGFSEELFFRAGVQRLLGYSLSKHGAIWITAILFSALHLQFYGFVPRMLLGALFGYLYFWSGSVWVSVIAHALNNSIVVTIAWVSVRYGINLDFSSEVIAIHGIPWSGILSGILTFFFIIKYKKYFFRNKHSLCK